jgi:hypothetical protein
MPDKSFEFDKQAGSGSPVCRLSLIRSCHAVMACGIGGDLAAYFAHPSSSWLARKMKKQPQVAA